jgi:hypothetical protein
MTFDPVRGSLVMYSGYWQGYGNLNDTWAFDGAAWSQVVTAHTPPPRYYPNIAYSAQLGGVVIFGGGADAGCSSYGDLWVLDSDWRQVTLPNAPLPRDGAGLVLDDSTGLLLLTHGRDQRCTSTPTFFSDSYLLGVFPGAGLSTWGSGCLGSNSVPQLTAAGSSLPRLGQNLVMQMANLPANGFFVPVFPFLGFSTSQGSLGSLPRDLGSIGMPGCIQFVDALASSFLFSLGGSSLWSIPIPNNFSFVGTTFHMQAAVLDANANPLGITLTNPCTASVGV